MTSRLDNFTDAAFAFGVSLMVIGGAGERGIWLILALTGLVSVLLTQTPYGIWAAMVYATLPVTIGLFVWRHDWEGKRA
jgi:hypothetical protein